MINNGKYAVILYYNELFEKNIENISDYLSRKSNFKFFNLKSGFLFLL